MTYNVGNPFSQADDPTNASGLGTPAIIRGTVYADKVSGLVVGSGQTTAVRQANATALQNAITYAVNNSKFFELTPGTYEISNSAGIVVPAGHHFVLRGAQYKSAIMQFATNAPILTLGDISTSSPTTSDFWDVQGLAVYYGVSQTGNTGAIALQIGVMQNSRISKIGVNPDQVSPYPAYVNVQINASSGNTGPFSCEFDDWNTWNAQNYNMYLVYNGATGNVWRNIYCRNVGALSQSQFYVNGGADRFEQLNIEAGSANKVMQAVNGVTTFHNLHLEDVVATGWQPGLIETSNGMYHFENVTVVNPQFLSANITAPSIGAVFQDYASGPSSISVDNLQISCSNNTAINENFVVYRTQAFNQGSLTGQPQSNSNGAPNFVIEKAYFSQSGGSTQLTNYCNLDLYQTLSNSGAQFLTPSKFGRYEWGQAGSRVIGATISIPSATATYNHYGILEDATLLVPASITGMTINLMDTMGTTGNEVPRTGARVHITRISGTMSGTLTVKDGGGTVLTTNTTAGGLDYRFNGSAWVAITGITPNTALI